MTVRRAIISNGNTLTGLSEGLALAIDDAAKNNTGLLILTPTKAQMENGLLVDLLGAGSTKALLKGQSIPLAPGCAISHATERKFTGYEPTKEVVLACWLNKDFMDKVDKTQPPAITYVSWLPADGERWLKRWGQLPGQDASGDLHPVVQRALSSITDAVNIANGLNHPRNKGCAKDTFFILHRAGYKLDGERIDQWATVNGWPPAEARKLGELAASIVAGKYAREPVGESWRPDILDIWRERVGE